MTSRCYDVIIVGAGLAGLKTGINILKSYKGLKCCILEKYNYTGGRVTTFSKNIKGVGKVQWENGAGRISETHTKVLGLFKKYGLTFVPISPETDYIDTYSDSDIMYNNFSDLYPSYLKPLETLSKDELSNKTIGEILDRLFGEKVAQDFYLKFPYYSEIHTLRADIALKSFKNEMRSNEGFGVCKEGLSALVQAMEREFLELGGEIIKNMELTSIESYKTTKKTLLTCNIIDNKCNLNNTTQFLGNVCVLALHHTALKNIDGIKNLYILNYLKMNPLVRIYAVFPKNKNGKVWFDGIPKVVTDSEIRYFIPIDYKRGIAMISYTDGDDAEYILENYSSLGNKFQNFLMNSLKDLFNGVDIPDPLFFKVHPWYDGCTYWLPGDYNVEKESLKSLYPLSISLPNVFMCGESFAVTQCWMESALDQADKLWNNDEFIKSLNKISN